MASSPVDVSKLYVDSESFLNDILIQVHSTLELPHLYA